MALVLQHHTNKHYTISTKHQTTSYATTISLQMAIRRQLVGKQLDRQPLHGTERHIWIQT